MMNSQLYKETTLDLLCSTATERKSITNKWMYHDQNNMVSSSFSSLGTIGRDVCILSEFV